MASLLLLLGILVACTTQPARPAAEAVPAKPASSGASAAPGTAPARPAEARASAPRPITVGLASPNAQYWDLYVAQDKGYFAEEGLAVEISLTRSSTGAMQAVAASAVEFGASTPDVPVAAIERGGDLVILASAVEKAMPRLVAQPSIRTIGDLRDKTLGVSALKGGELAMTRRLLAANGLGPDDYDVQVAGATPEKYAALTGGAMTAVVLFQPADFEAMGQGYTPLGLLDDATPDFPFIVYVARRSWAQAEKPATVGFLRALARGREWLLNRANREAAVGILVEKAKLAPASAGQTYDLFMDQRVFGSGEVSLTSFERVLEFLVADGDLTTPTAPPSKYVDGTYFQESRRS
jgi:ABC-type nitrate/sulfonate/bicarbonate transport system substrate-binding protein